MKAFRVYTGPVAVKQVALRLSEAGAGKVYEGTQSVYFALRPGCPQTKDEAQAFVQEVFPHAGYEVEQPLHVEWPFG
jgi:hypothetical protein